MCPITTDLIATSVPRINMDPPSVSLIVALELQYLDQGDKIRAGQRSSSHFVEHFRHTWEAIMNPP